MTGDELPDGGHVVHYVRPSFHENGRVYGSAFCLRKEERGLSVNWLECFPGLTKLQQVNAVRGLSRLNIKSAGRFAELNVGRVKQHIRDELDMLRFVHEPLPAIGQYRADPSHSEIAGLPPKDTPESELIGDMIAECIEAVHPV